MKARKVKGLDPAGPLADQLERIVLVRLDELCGFWPRVTDPREVEALHDMRIAAKRLRYLLEVSEGLFGPYAAKAVKRVKELQDLLGEVHDADVHLPDVLAAQLRVRRADVARAVDAASADPADDLDPRLAAAGPYAEAHRGLATLATYHEARRELLHGRFVELWRDLERAGFRARLEYAVAERPDDPGGSRDDDVASAPLP